MSTGVGGGGTAPGAGREAAWRGAAVPPAWAAPASVRLTRTAVTPSTPCTALRASRARVGGSCWVRMKVNVTCPAPSTVSSLTIPAERTSLPRRGCLSWARARSMRACNVSDPGTRGKLPKNRGAGQRWRDLTQHLWPRATAASIMHRPPLVRLRLADALTRVQAAFAGRYVIEREIGRGGMATVYLARDVKHDRAAAIKVVDPEAASAIAIERFLREIKVAARLQHPHILPFYDSGTASAFLYYVMPYVAGESLRERLEREKQLRLEDALRITREVAEALEYAHHYGIVHRDIKPANILLADDQAMVVDFGVARAFAAAGEEKLTQTGLAVGTPGYMSPEQASGSARVDGRSDIYSLGCVSYEMLAGSPPFTGSTPQAILARHLADPVPPLRTVRRSVPLSAEQAILRALVKVPADREAPVTQFADALEAPASPARPRLRPWLVAGVTAVAAPAALHWVVAIRSSAGRGAGRGGGGGAAGTSPLGVSAFLHGGAALPPHRRGAAPGSVAP